MEAIGVTLPEGLIQQVIEAEIVKALSGGDHERIVQALVRQVVTSKVRRGYKEIPLMTAMLEDAVIAKVKTALEAVVDKESDKIAALVAKAMSGKVMADAFSSALVGTMKDMRWGVNVTFAPRQ